MLDWNGSRVRVHFASPNTLFDNRPRHLLVSPLLIYIMLHLWLRRRACRRTEYRGDGEGMGASARHEEVLKLVFFCFDVLYVRGR